MTNELDLEVINNPNAQEDNEKKAHPWRFCGEGRHCAENPGHVKDMLSVDEIHAIADEYFSDLPGQPIAGILTKRAGDKTTDQPFKNPDKYDNLIRGWVHYWNDVLKPMHPMEPNIVKALMASESGFNETSYNYFIHKGKKVPVRGLLQITEETWRILNDHKGELHDHYVDLIEQDLFDPSVNICAGVRWLFQKHNLLSKLRMQRAKKDPTKPYQEPTWQETIIYYKGYSSDKEKGFQIFQEFYNQLQRG